MRMIRFNSIGGASGNMILGALAGLGLDLDELNRQLQSLLPEENYSITITPAEQYHFAGIHADVEIRTEPHHHRHLADIETIINNSSLPDTVKTNAVKVFNRLAEAEAKVHGTTPDHIHFHEVGAIDSIVDIVGCCLALHMLNVEKVGVGSLPLGCGTVQCAHGVLPVPVPATVELLRGMAVCQTDEPFELVTPTGAALLSCWQSDLPANGKVLASAYGFGTRKLNSRPNMLRAILLESGDSQGDECHDRCMVMECNIDDCPPEIVGSLFDRLFKAGALEVFSQPVLMKKQRHGMLLTVICLPELMAALEEIIFSETTTFGIRSHQVERSKLSRRMVTVVTPYGKISLKAGFRDHKLYSLSPEHDDCVAAAALHDVTVKEVYTAATIAGRELKLPFLND